MLTEITTEAERFDRARSHLIDTLGVMCMGTSGEDLYVLEFVLRRVETFPESHVMSPDCFDDTVIGFEAGWSNFACPLLSRNLDVEILDRAVHRFVDAAQALVTGKG